MHLLPTTALAALLLLPVAAGCEQTQEAPPVHADVISLNGEWTVTTLDGGPVVPQTSPPVSVTFQDFNIGGTGRVVGFAGVNRFFGDYSASQDGRMTISALGSTRMAGPADLMSFESAFMERLGSTQRFTAGPDQTTLETTAGTIVLTRSGHDGGDTP